MELHKINYLRGVTWKKEIAGIALWIFLNVSDLIVTIISMIVLDGGFIEGNPIAALIGENYIGLVAYKLVLTIIAIVLLSHIRKLKVLHLLNIIMAAVVGWNLALFFASLI